MKKILLIGNPNVGKSAVFTRLTGINIVTANYPGSTVEYTKGYLNYDVEKFQVIDVPGTYSLMPTNRAEEVAVKILEENRKSNDIILANVIDSTNLERNLNLTLQLIKLNIPMVIVLNFWDETKHKGIKINHEALEEILNVPVIKATAVSGEGIKYLVENIKNGRKSDFKFKAREIWQEIGKIISEVQELSHKHHNIFEILSEATINPLTGIPIAIIILLIVFSVIRLIGESLIKWALDPFFNHIAAPLLLKLSALLGHKGFMHGILIGTLIDGNIDFTQSFGLLTTGLYVPVAVVMPYILAFYLILCILEDTGYLPRLSILLDRAMHLIGLHGMGFIPMMLGLGCNVPGALACRTLESKKERFIACTVMAISVPCWAKTAMIIGLVGKFGARGLSIVFGTLFLVFFTLGLILKIFVKGESPEIFTEIPPYRFPYIPVLLKKLWMRIIYFLKEALPLVLLGVMIVNLLYAFKIIDFIGNLTKPVITNLFGLPKEAIGAIIVGFLRKDVAIGMLAPLNMTFRQIAVACVVLSMYFPCMGTFFVIFRELGIIDMLKSSSIMLVSTLVVGSLLNFILSIFFV